MSTPILSPPDCPRCDLNWRRSLVGRLLLTELDRLAKARVDFAFETTLSGLGHVGRFKLSPDGNGFVLHVESAREGRFEYFEYISLDKLLDDAERRNLALFHRLGIVTSTA